MPHLPTNATLWLERAEIDYIGPFVKAWAAFNAWFRHASGSRKDIEGLRYVKTQVNPVRGVIMPLLRPREVDSNGRTLPDGEDAKQFKALIRNLHAALDSYSLEVVRDDNVEQISFRSVCLINGVNLPKSKSHRSHNYQVDKRSGVWTSTVTRRSGGTPPERIDQTTYNASDLQIQPAFQKLSLEQRAQLLALYKECNPRPMSDLLNGNHPPIIAGDIVFCCTEEELFSGLIEIIYGMRNALLHGELQPHEQAFQAYEQAYRIVIRLLDCLRS